MPRLTGPQKTAVEAFLTALDTRRGALQTLLKDLSDNEAPATFVAQGMAVDRAAMSLIKELEDWLRRDDDKL